MMLIGCEHSGVVRGAMRAKGIDAWCCDLLPADDKSPYHIQGDVRAAMKSRPWSAFGLHPDCTFLTVAGIHWNDRGRGWEKTNQALAFVRELIELAGDVPCYLENPVSIISTHIRKPTQTIQPYDFGEDASKRTCLWLNRLPALHGTTYVPPRWVCECGGVVRPTTQKPTCCPHCDVFGARLLPRWSNQTDSGQNRLGPSEDRWKERSRTYPGIAAAMAQQWGSLQPLI